jgi:hypothetical protein
MPYKQHIQQAVKGFNPITLKDLDSVKLMNRVDSKFVFNIKHFENILTELQQNYSILEIESKRVFRYESLYFDTPSYLLYRHHHCGKPARVKVRYRKYVDSNLVFFEVKKKTKTGRTDKHRIVQPEISRTISGAETALLNKMEVNLHDLEEKVWVYFDRITMASNDTQERITIDMNLMLEDAAQKKSFPNAIIAEVKQERYSRLSKFVEVLRKRNIPELSISKYALSVVTMKDDVKKNNFKAMINKLNKIHNS